MLQYQMYYHFQIIFLIIEFLKMMQSYHTDLFVPYMQNYLAPSYPIFQQIKTLLSSVTNKKTMRSAKSQIIYLVEKAGPQGEKFLLKSLLEALDVKECREKMQASSKATFLGEQIKQYSFNSSFLSYFAQIVADVADSTKAPEVIDCIINCLKIPLPNQISIALALYLSDRQYLAKIGEEQMQKKLIELRESGKDVQIPEKILEQLLFQIKRNPQLLTQIQTQYEYLLEHCQKMDKHGHTKIYNYLKGDWRYFANEQIVLEKNTVINIKKVDLLKDFGPTATLSMQSLKAILCDGTPINEQDVFQCLLMISQDKSHVDSGMQKFMTDIYVASKKNMKADQLRKIYSAENNSKKFQTNWNIDNLITFFVQNVTNLRWPNVMNQLDRHGLKFSSEESFLNLMKYFEKAKKQGPKFKTPQNIFIKKWNNYASQANFLYEVFRCKQPQVLGLNQMTNRKIQRSVRDVNILSKQIWGHLDLLQLLIQVSDYKYVQIRQLMEGPMQKFPDLIIQCLAEIKPSRGQAMLDELFSQLFPIYLHNHTTYAKILQSLWEANQDLVISCICQLYKNDNKKQNAINLSRVLDIAQAIKESLIPLTNWNDYQFTVPLAILAGKRQFLHFEPWINDRIKNAGNPFLKAILSYLQQNLLAPIRILLKQGIAFSYQNQLEKAQLSKQLLAFIFESIFITSSSSKMSKRNFEKLKRVYKEVCQYFPQMSESQMPDQIQQMAQRQFHNIYKKKISIQQAVEHMYKLKNSKKQQQTEQFASMITFMFSQTRFHIDYPEAELMITADLFSGIVNKNLIQRKLFNVLLRLLQLDLKQDNCKYNFAIAVVKQIKQKLAHEPEFCEKLIDNQYMMSKDPELIEELIKNLDPPIDLQVQRQRKIKQAIKIKNNPPQVIPSNIVIEEDIPVQALKKVDNDFDILTVYDKTTKITFKEKDLKVNKINTLCNTLSVSNIQEKAKDLSNLLNSEQAIRFGAYYFVFKRIIQGTNNGGSQILHRLIQKVPKVEKPMINITYRILNYWFSLTNKSINDKKLNNFKNLGYWIGKVTINRKRIIPIHKLNLRQILINSFIQNNGVRIPMNVPVILKMLEHINSHPEIFKAMNPWLGKILGALNEIQEKLKEDSSATKSQIKAFFRSTEMRRESFNIPTTTYITTSEIPLISQLPQYIKINKDQYEHYINQGIDLKIIITKAVDDSIQQIVDPVIDRAVKIAIVTTKNLIMKDFAYEPDVEKLKVSSYNVVKKLAGPLAQVTCRQPLKASMNRNLKNYLSQHINDQNEIQNIITRATPDNLDLGCALIKKAVIQNAEQMISKDPNINQAIQMRNKALSKNEMFKDQNFLKDIPAIVPQQLRPKPGGLTHQQFMIYDAFRKDRKPSISPQKYDSRTNAQKAIEIFNDRGQVKDLKEYLNIDATIKKELLAKVLEDFCKQPRQQSEDRYLISVCQILRDYVQPNQAWNAFKEKIDVNKKDNQLIAKKLLECKFFNEKIMQEIDQGNQQENKAISLFQKWLDTAHQQIEPFLHSLQEIFNKSENEIKIFFEYSLNYAMMKVATSLTSPDSTMNTTYIEDYSKLIIILLKLIADNNCTLYLEHTTQAILSVFNKLQSSQSKISYQRPFFKIFLNLICDTTRKQYSFDSQKILTFYCVLAKAFHKINPLLCPNFAFAWFELISNKYFIPVLLEKRQFWDLYYQLICDLLRFSTKYLIEQNLAKPEYQKFYKGVLKLIVVLVHDFPDFLNEFSLLLCLQTPDWFIQIRNAIISVYPKNMKFQKPQHYLNRETAEKQLKQFSTEPSEYSQINFETNKFNQFISILQSQSVQSAKSKLEAQSDEQLQLFILYITKSNCHNLTTNNSKKLLIDLILFSDGYLRERVIKYILNLIRYPNIITLFLIETITTIIFKQGHEKIRSSILSKILERVKAENPHPWGIIFLLNKFQIQKNELLRLGIPQDILNQF